MARTLIVGFDGATEGLCDRWIAEDRMPVLAGLRGDGSHGDLRSTMPYNSAVAWTSLSTGASPGRHGVYDFVLPREREYGYRVATREDRRVAALWGHAGQAGAEVAVVNIPMTFPAEDVRGVMVSGMDAPRLEERSVSPAGYLPELLRMCPDYRISSKAATKAGAGEWETAERELIEVVEARSRFVQALVRSRSLDLVMVNLEATDGAQHFFWQHHDPGHPRHDPRLAERWGDTIGRVYAASDRELGRIIDAYRPDTVFVVSDHGGGPTTDWVLFTNDWLASEGLLRIVPRRTATMGQRLYGKARSRLSVPVRRALRPVLGRVLERAKGAALYGDVDWSSTKAYAHMQPAVRVNLAGREPQGSVTADAAAGVLEDVAARAGALTLPDGGRVVTEALSAEEAYSGSAPGGPDLLLDLAPGTHVRSRNTFARSGHLVPLADLGLYLPSGVHTRLGMVVAAGAGIERRGHVAESDIHQVAPSVMAVMGVPAPPMDGDPFEFVTASFQSSGDDLASTTATGTDFSAEEEEEVLERLRGLGYVD
jgi:predicted AlkP superfamily phosphohydrolase/phosphomutase